MTPGIVSRRAVKNRAKRRAKAGANRPQPTVQIKVTAATALGAVMTIEFDQPVSLNGTPAYTTDVVGATALSAVKTGINTVAITFSATVATATEVRIPYEEPAVRNGSGGFVSTSTFPV